MGTPLYFNSKNATEHNLFKKIKPEQKNASKIFELYHQSIPKNQICPILSLKLKCSI